MSLFKKNKNKKKSNENSSCSLGTIMISGADHHYTLNIYMVPRETVLFSRESYVSRDEFEGNIKTRRIDDRNKDVLPSFVIAI